MIRPFTAVSMILAAGSMLYVYQTKHQGQLLDKEIARTLKATDAVRDRMVVLRADWSQLNEPARLSDLARQHLSLATTAQGQLVALSDLAGRLPPPLPPGTTAMPPDEPAVVAAAPMPAGAAPVVATAKPAPSPRPVAVAVAAPQPGPAPRPVQVASLPMPPTAPSGAVSGTGTAPALPTPPAPRAASRPSSHAGDRPSPEAPADNAADHAPQTQGPAGRALANADLPMPPPPAPRPRILAPVVTAVAPPIQAPQPVRRVAAPAVSTVTVPSPPPVIAAAQYVPPAVTQSYGSVLGGARTALPAPVPYTASR